MFLQDQKKNYREEVIGQMSQNHRNRIDGKQQDQEQERESLRATMYDTIRGRQQEKEKMNQYREDLLNQMQEDQARKSTRPSTAEATGLTLDGSYQNDRVPNGQQLRADLLNQIDQKQRLKGEQRQVYYPT